jgi:hypothetical protein
VSAPGADESQVVPPQQFWVFSPQGSQVLELGLHSSDPLQLGSPELTSQQSWFKPLHARQKEFRHSSPGTHCGWPAYWQHCWSVCPHGSGPQTWRAFGSAPGSPRHAALMNAFVGSSPVGSSLLGSPQQMPW